MTGDRPFTELAWCATAGIRAAIDRHAFVTGLRDGTLPRATYVEYLTQDAHYLIGFARALSTCAAQATEIDDLSFWAFGAHDSIIVERSLHAGQVADLTAVEPSPTCLAYLSFLGATAGRGCYPVLAAALLPCFWIYEDAGRRLKGSVESAGHPYQEWIATYGDPAFATATARARDIVDRSAEQSSTAVRRAMHSAFTTASRYEWMFFDAAWRGETWPDFDAANGSASTTATTKEATEADSHG
jgi:thiaminase/transcriptional activator TenA